MEVAAQELESAANFGLFSPQSYERMQDSLWGVKMWRFNNKIP